MLEFVFYFEAEVERFLKVAHRNERDFSGMERHPPLWGLQNIGAIDRSTLRGVVELDPKENAGIVTCGRRNERWKGVQRAIHLVIREQVDDVLNRVRPLAPDDRRFEVDNAIERLGIDAPDLSTFALVAVREFEKAERLNDRCGSGNVGVAFEVVDELLVVGDACVASEPELAHSD